MFRSLFTQLTNTDVRRSVARVAGLAAITLMALVSLSGTAHAQRFADLRVHYSFPTVPWVGGGDADVYTKSGRTTYVNVSTGVPYLYPNGLSGFIELIYEIREGASNYTMLRRREYVPFYAPTAFRIKSIGINRRPANFSRRYYGQDHEWHDESDEVTGTFLQSLYTKFDGPGRDDKGNAALSATIQIGVELEPLVK